MEITSMLTENTDVPAPRPQEAARPALPPKATKRKGTGTSAKVDVRSKRALAATKHRLAETDAYTMALAAFFAQGELSWQKEGVLSDLRQMLRISEEHHQREMQRLWANPTLCALARAQNGGRENADRGRFVYDILPDPKSPSDTESEVEDANAMMMKKKKKKKKSSSKPSAPSSLPPAPSDPTPAPAAPPVAAPVAASASVQPSPLSDKPSTKLVLKKAAKKPADLKTEVAIAAPPAAAIAAPAPPPPKPPVDEMTRLQMERQKLQEELARLGAEEDEEDDDEGQDEDDEVAARPLSGMGGPGVGMQATSPGESEDE